MGGDLMIEELDDLEKFLLWFLWRCERGGIRSRWTRAVAQDIADRYELSPAMFTDEDYQEFKPKGMFYND